MPDHVMDAVDEVQAALRDFDACFASGDAAGLTDLFTSDAQLLLLHTEPIEGRPAILAHWTRLFGDYDTSSWHADHPVVEVHGDRAYTFSTYTETLIPRGDGASRDVKGRLILFLRRDAGESWLVALAMNSHVRPVREVASKAS